MQSAAPDSAGPGRPGPKPRFSREKLVDVAIRIADEEGLDALSLRAVARRLAVTPMALYTYIENKEELVDLVVDRLIRERARGFEWPDRYKDALRALAYGVRRLVEEHPVMLEAYQRRGVFTPEAMRTVDDVLERLASAGLSRAEAVDAYAAVHLFVLGYAAIAQHRSTRLHHGTTAARPDAEAYPTLEAHYDEFLNVLDPERFPRALELILQGVAARVEGRAQGSRGAR